MSSDFSFLKDNIDLMILNALFGGDKYGYEISKEISDKTDGQYVINSSTLYSYLKRLNSSGLVDSYWGMESNGGRRRYYTLTAKGKDFCKQTSAEWNNQKTMVESLVLDNLTAATDLGEDLQSSQQPTDSPKLHNLRFPRIKRHKTVDAEQLQKQKKIAEQLQDVTNSNSENVEHQQQISHQQQSSDIFEAKTPQQNFATQQDIIEQVDSQVVAQNKPDQDTAQDKLKIFDVIQDDADEFIKKFDQSALEISSRPYEPADDQYKRMFDSILSEQIEQMERFNDEQPQMNELGFANDRPLALEEMANQLARDGIRVRIFNSTTAVYKSKELFPTKKVYCLTAWCAISAVIALLGLLCLATLETGTYLDFVLSMCLLLVIPLVFSVLAIVDPIRKIKPDLNFRTLLIASTIVSAVVIVLSFGINILFNLVQFSNVGAVATQIGIPSIISLALPFAVLFVRWFFKRYTK